MITQELIQFIQQGISQGKTKEELKQILLSNGDWLESDVEEAFSSINTNVSNSMTGSATKDSGGGLLKWLMVSVIIFVLGVGGYLLATEFITPNTDKGVIETTNFPEAFNEEVSEVFIPDSEDLLTENSLGVSNENNQKIICGTNNSVPMMGDTNFDDNEVLRCLGENILNGCQSASAILGQIGGKTYTAESYKESGVCRFKVTIDDKSIQCPISIANTIDEEASNAANDIITKNLDKSNPAEFAANLSIFNTGLIFLENEYNKSMIEGLGCSGSLITERISQRQASVSGFLRSQVMEPISNSRVEAEFHYNDNGAYLDVCTSIYARIPELQEIDAKCYDSADEFAIAAPLKEGGFICADDSGFLGDIESNITSTSCN
ncbi:hypothetical protein GW765_03105 [Candidatus Parcubacteria bacterium]|nr:hypothetical protein [Candidatus Parcubacteria bacterium]